MLLVFLILSSGPTILVGADDGESYSANVEPIIAGAESPSLENYVDKLNTAGSEFLWAENDFLFSFLLLENSLKDVETAFSENANIDGAIEDYIRAATSLGEKLPAAENSALEWLDSYRAMVQKLSEFVPDNGNLDKYYESISHFENETENLLPKVRTLLSVSNELQNNVENEIVSELGGLVEEIKSIIGQESHSLKFSFWLSPDKTSYAPGEQITVYFLVYHDCGWSINHGNMEVDIDYERIFNSQIITSSAISSVGTPWTTYLDFEIPRPPQIAIRVDRGIWISSHETLPTVYYYGGKAYVTWVKTSLSSEGGTYEFDGQKGEIIGPVRTYNDPYMQAYIQHDISGREILYTHISKYDLSEDAEVYAIESTRTRAAQGVILPRLWSELKSATFTAPTEAKKYTIRSDASYFDEMGLLQTREWGVAQQELSFKVEYPEPKPYPVDPVSDKLGMPFIFSVDYIHPGNAPPTYVKLYIDGTFVGDMQFESWLGAYGDYTTGAKYFLTRTPTEREDIGQHSYYIEVSDGYNVPPPEEGTFEVTDPVPVPTLLIPDDYTIHNLNVPLKWEPSEGASHYQVQVSSSPTFDTYEEHLTTSTQLNLSFPGDRYYWRVSATAGSYYEVSTGAALWSRWSDARSFNLDILDGPALTGPEDGFTSVTGSVTFSWEEVLGASAYHITVGSTGATTTSTSKTIGLPNGDYSWYVQAIRDGHPHQIAEGADDLGWGWPSESRRFSVSVPGDITPPDDWQNQQPDDWVNTQTPTCTVEVRDTESGLDVSTAEYQFSTDGGATWSAWMAATSTGSDGTTDFQTITAANVPFNQDSGTSNLIRFRITDMEGNTGTSPDYTIRIDTVAPDVNSTTPADGATGVTPPTDIQVTFSEEMDISTVQLTSDPNPGNWVPTWSNNNSTVTYDHTNFTTNTDYTIEITGEDIAGNPLGTFTFSFHTVGGGPPGGGPGGGGCVFSREFSHVFVKFSEVKIFNSDTVEWLSFPITNDTLDIQWLKEHDAYEILGRSEIDEGRYTKIRYSVSEATGVKRATGERVVFDVQSPDLEIDHQFDVEWGEFVLFVAHLDLEASIDEVAGGYEFSPVLEKLRFEKYPFEVVVSPSTAEIEAGDTADYAVKIINRGETDETYSLTLSTDIPDSWIDPPASNVSVPGGQEKDVELKITAPPDFLATENTIYSFKVQTSAASSAATQATYGILKISDLTPPPAPSQISPESGLTTLDNTPTFRWSTVEDPSGVAYDLQVYPYPTLPDDWMPGWNYRMPIDLNYEVPYENKIFPTEGLVSRWTFNNSVADNWGSNHGAIHGNPEFVEGKYGNALKFDGVDDFVEIPVSPSLNNLNALTWSVWVKIDQPSQGIMSKYLMGHSGEWFVDTYAKKPYFVTVSGNGRVEAIGNTTLSTGEWYHLAGTYDGGAMNVYVNGVSAGGASQSGPLQRELPLLIGSLGQYYYFNGTIDEILLYNRALSPSEIKYIYERQVPPPVVEDLTDYQVQVTLDPSNFDYSKVKQDGSDLRFTSGDGKTKLEYWMETWNPGGVSRIWVQVPTIPEGESRIYMFYGNAEAESAENIDATFLLFDNFEGDTIDAEKWSVSSMGGTYSLTNGVLTLNNYRADSKQTFGPGTACRARVSLNAVLRSTLMVGFVGNDGLDLAVAGAALQDSEYFRYWNRSGSTSAIDSNLLVDSNWRIFQIGRGESANVFSIDDGHVAVNGESLSKNPMALFSMVSGPSEMNIDWVLVRRHATFEPTLTMGAEESPEVTIGITSGLAENSHEVPKEQSLSPGAWFWRVRAVDGAGKVGPWSEGLTFEVQADVTPPQAPELTSPEHGSITDNVPTFVWSAVEDPTGVSYTLQYSQKPVFESPTGWLEGWKYRRPVEISSTASADLTDYQTSILLDTASLISGGKLKADASDTRLASADGTVLPHWIESGLNTSLTKIWVKIPSIPASGTTEIYAYYGKPEALSVESADGVFDFWEGFDGPVLDPEKWNSVGSYEINSGSLELTGIESDLRAYTVDSFTRPLVIETRLMTVSQGPHTNWWWGYGTSPLQAPNFGVRTTWDSIWWLTVTSGSQTDSTNMPMDLNAGLWRISSLEISDKTVAKLTDPDGVLTSYWTVGSDRGIYLSAWSGTQAFDWVRVRKFAPQEPTARFGAEEELPEGETITIEGIAGNSYSVESDHSLVAGSWQWRVRAVDGAGNESGWTQAWKFEVMEDDTPPVSSVDQIEPRWRNEPPITITAQAADDLSGVEKVDLWYRYSADNLAWGEWTEFASAGEESCSWEFGAPEGDGYYEFYSIAVDGVGNVEPAPDSADAVAGLDTIAPEIAVSSPQADGQYVAKLDTITIDFSVQDAMDPAPAYSAYLTDMEEGTVVEVELGQIIEPLSIDDGFWTLTVEAEDWAGNLSSLTTGEFEVVHDVQPPMTTIEVGTPQYIGDSLYVTSATEFTLNAEDDLIEVGDGIGLGVEVTEYRIDEGSPTAYGAPFTVSGEGQHTIYYRSADVVGNTEAEKSIPVVVDDTPPESSVQPLSTYWHVSMPFTLSATASDELSGVDHVELYYRSSGDGSGWGPWLPYGADTDGSDGWSWSFSAWRGSERDGYYEFRSVAADMVGNLEAAPEAAEARAAVDTVAPESSADPLDYWQLSSSFEVTASAEDPASSNGSVPSGVDRVEMLYRHSSDNLTWGDWVSLGVRGEAYSWAFDSPAGYGFYQIYAVSEDVAGNAEEAPAEPDRSFCVIIPATVDIDPDTLNLKSNGRWITAYVELPEGYDVGEIVVVDLWLEGVGLFEGTLHAEWWPTGVGDYDEDGVQELMVKFDRPNVQEIVEVGENVEMTLFGKVGSVPFRGSDNIRVINPVPEKASPGNSGGNQGNGQGPPSTPPGHGGTPPGQEKQDQGNQGNGGGNNGNGKGKNK